MCSLHACLAAEMLMISGVIGYGMYRGTHIPREAVQEGPTALLNETEPVTSTAIVSGLAVKAGLQQLLDRVGIRQDLAFLPIAQRKTMSHGDNFFTGGAAAITYKQDLHSLDEHASLFLIKRKVSAIKDSASFLRGTSIMIMLLATAILLILQPPKAVLYFALGLQHITLRLLQHYETTRADNFAIENSSDEELKGGLRFFKSLQQRNLSYRNTFWNTIRYSPIGDDRLNFANCLTNRIEKIEGALQRRNITTTDSEEEPKILAITNLLLRPLESTASETASGTAQAV